MAISKLAAQTETYTPTPRRPQLIWQGRGRRRVADPVPSQTLEIVRPVHLARVSHGAAEPGLWQGEEGAPENRLIWTNDNLVALTSLLRGDDEHEPLEGKVDLIYIDPPSPSRTTSASMSRLKMAYRTRSCRPSSNSLPMRTPGTMASTAIFR